MNRTRRHKFRDSSETNNTSSKNDHLQSHLFSETEAPALSLADEAKIEKGATSLTVSHRTGGKLLAPIKAIRAKCLNCSNGQYKEVKLCPVKDCALYHYRLGHRPRGNEQEGHDVP